MPTSEELATKISGTTPWWASAPVWLAAGIVGVPSLMAIGAGYFIAQRVTQELRKLESYNLNEVALLHEHDAKVDRNWVIILKTADQILRVEYIRCVNEAQNPTDRSKCLTAEQQERQILGR